jgi:glycosyltransferase involved in cell wall biosynthesis
MLLSVIIPLYNKGPFIEAALRSILEQHYQRFEVIIIDDGSIDDGPAKVQKIGDERVKLYRQENKGVACARNEGIKHASGDVICFLDADDGYHPEYLSTVVQMATAHSGMSFFACGYKLVNTSTVENFTWSLDHCGDFKLIRDFFSAWRMNGYFLCTNSVAVRSSILKSMQPCFPPDESMGEDQDLWFRLAEHHELLYCPARLVIYRQDVAGSLSNTLCRNDFEPAYQRLEARAIRQEMPAEKQKSALRLVNERKISVARAMLFSGERKTATLQLLHLTYAWTSRRWWVSLALCLCGPSYMINIWERWRYAKAKKAFEESFTLK